MSSFKLMKCLLNTLSTLKRNFGVKDMTDSVNKTCKCSETNTKPKLKILAIHGYRQNAETFKQKTGSFRKMVHKWAEFTYITAPHKVTLIDDLNQTDDINIGQSQDEEQYGWFFNRDDHTFRGIRKGGPAIGFADSVKFVEEVFEKEGPFDGILGFSQGACFVGLLCDLQQRHLTKCKFNFAIMASGFKSGCLPHLKYFIETITLPSLHVYGESDKIIPTEMSGTLSEAFLEPRIVKHPGGHYLPATAAQKHAYQSFFRDQYLREDDVDDETIVF
ncbi:esterase AGAP003155 isoform X1 [Tribolium madens]|uniref:esterase AGAP003155 isoform X1 n=2 Tax=Tribolium madens TaxID=41895 RepID=UPI001CF721FA|nr:esterase AGAP003155 isoform X1 [Tribolium madens]